jgi:transcriptional regulator NrdR family protein
MTDVTDKPPTGIACKQCGCRDLRVRHTRRFSHFIRRYRVCRNCGKVRVTVERAYEKPE